MTVEELRNIIKTNSKTDQSDRYADAFLSFVLDCPRSDLDPKANVSDKEAKIAMEVSSDWLKAVALGYERGKWRFHDMPLYIEKGVIPPTFIGELLVDAAIDRFKDKDTVLEIGTGCGNIAIALAKNTGAKLTATDITDESLALAKKNARLNDVEIEFIKSDMFKSVKHKYNAIISNPPAATSELLDELEQSGKLQMPRSSRDAGSDGMYFHRIIVANCKDHLKENGVLALAIAYDRLADPIENLIIKDASFKTCNVELLWTTTKKRRAIFAPVKGEKSV